MNMETAEFVYGLLKPLDDRIAALEAEDGTIPLLSAIANHLNTLALSAMEQSGLIRLDVDEGGSLTTTIVSAEDRERMRAPTTRFLNGKTSTRHGDGAPLAWVLYPPAPYNDVELVCVPDGESLIGMRCTAEKKVRGQDKTVFDVTFTERSKT